MPSRASRSESVSAIDRRAFLMRGGVVSAVGIGGVAVPTNVLAAVAGPRVRAFNGRYAVDGHRVVSGYFAAPRGRAGLNVVLLVSKTGAPDAATESAARDYAAAGWLAIAPDLRKTYPAASIGGQAGMVSALQRDVPRFAKMGRANGKVAIVSA